MTIREAIERLTDLSKVDGASMDTPVTIRMNCEAPNDRPLYEPVIFELSHAKPRKWHLPKKHQRWAVQEIGNTCLIVTAT